MNDLLRHRGPDGEATWVHDHGVRGVRAPAPGDHRPRQRRPADDRRRRQLDHLQRRDLQLHRAARRCSARTASTRAPTPRSILRAYRQWGEGCLERLRGMFAFALWDEETQTLFCARDRFGIKPFYYTVVDGVLYFASEVKALLPFLPRDRDRSRRARRLPHLPVPARREDAVQGRPGAAARPLPPRPQRHRRDAGATGRSTSSPTSTTPPTTSRGGSQELLADSIALHLRADVPIGAYLSGGLDSSIVASLASTDARPGNDGLHRPIRGCRATTRAATPASVADDARLRAARDRDRRRTTSSSDIERGRSTTSTTRSPGPGSFPQFMVSELAAQHRKVVLGGQGGDEIFGGYVALPDRVLRAVHQGRDRRDDAQRQLRRHLRVDHPEPQTAARVQAAAAGVLARGPLRGPRRALLPADQPRAGPRRRDRLGRARRLLAVRDVPADLPRRQRQEGVATSTA